MSLYFKSLLFNLLKQEYEFIKRKIAVITGAARGIGKAIALKYVFRRSRYRFYGFSYR